MVCSSNPTLKRQKEKESPFTLCANSTKPSWLSSLLSVVNGERGTLQRLEQTKEIKKIVKELHSQRKNIFAEMNFYENKCKFQRAFCKAISIKFLKNLGIHEISYK